MLVGVDQARWGEHRPTVGADAHGPAAVVDGTVMVGAEEH
jgi:hypothetical protein